MRLIKLKVLDPRIGREFPFPQYKTGGASAVDLVACLDTNLKIYPGETHFIPTGISLHIEDANITALILPRSGLGANHGIVLGNGTGVIDSDYQGPIKVALWNRENRSHTIAPGDRIAQMVFLPIITVGFYPVNSFAPTDRGEGGFGSTGK